MNVNPRDIWDTPPEAVQSLLRHLPRNIGFYEPCAGAGALSNALEAHGHRCLHKSDIAPRNHDISQNDALEVIAQLRPPSTDVFDQSFIITNPPFSRESMGFCRDLIIASAHKRQTWFLLPLAFAANVQNANIMKRFYQKVVTIGRLKWKPGTRHKERRDMAWFLFSNFGPPFPIQFFPYSGAK